MEGPHSVIDRTIFVVDCDATALASNKIQIRVPKATDIELGEEDSQLVEIDRTIFSYCAEAVTEYSRIVFDLFPEESQLCIVRTNGPESQIARHCTWNPEHQSLQKILEGFKKVSTNGKAGITAALDAAVHYLTEPAPLDSEAERFPYAKRATGRNRTRIVCLLQHQAEAKGDYSYIDEATGQTVDLPRAVSSLVIQANDAIYSNGKHEENGRNLRIESCELVIIKLASEKEVNHTSAPIAPQQLSKAVSANSHVVHSSQLNSALQDLACIHFGLQSARIRGIPMREIHDRGSNRTIYEVEILFQSNQNKPVDWSEYSLASCNYRKSTEKYLRWKSVDRKTNAELLPSKSAHRITPLEFTSPHSQSFVRHLFSGKPVFLVTETEVDEIPAGPVSSVAGVATSHLVVAHGEECYIHALSQSNPAMNEIPMTAYNSNMSMRGHRAKDFATLMVKNLMKMPAGEVDEEFATLRDGSRSAVSLEKLTRYWPLNENETLLFAEDQAADLKVLLEPIKNAFLWDFDSPDALETCTALLNRYFQAVANNETRMFPPLSDRFTARSDAYRKLSLELYKFMRVYASNPAHGVLVRTMEKLAPDVCREYKPEPTVMQTEATTAQRSTGQVRSGASKYSRDTYEIQESAPLYSNLMKQSNVSVSGNENDSWKCDCLIKTQHSANTKVDV
eukprot:TRINITY_DN8220_c0_g1_i1.p1 TRINITY_DN8220_c0_g1~~TRINITY_DN8220_c0_g1_i1.p1  ORF type:complete len:694 (-),score=122.35 TRINITY_DN8220_c0_g1_i1:35-2068(-)